MPSTVIAAFDYDEESSRLVVRFRTGRRYAYEGVPADLVAELRLAFAKGACFNQRIRGRFAAVRLEDG